VIREARGDADLATFLALREAIEPLTASTVADMRAFDAHAEAPLRVLVEQDGRAAGIASAMKFRDEDVADGLLGVLTSHRGRGLGGALLDRLDGHVREHGWRSLQLSVREGADAVWLARRGFEQVDRQPRVVLELAAPASNTVLQALDGVELTDATERPGLVDALHPLVVAGLRDVPGALAAEPLTLGAWRDWQSVPSRRPEFLVVALVDGEPAGFAQLNVYPRVGYHGFTTVVRAHRGRGIARALKLELIRRARERGLERLITQSNEDNVAMRTLNESLGYRPAPALVVMRRSAR
jgi:mycothiol synthase